MNGTERRGYCWPITFITLSKEKHAHVFVCVYVHTHTQGNKKVFFSNLKSKHTFAIREFQETWSKKVTLSNHNFVESQYFRAHFLFKEVQKNLGYKIVARQSRNLRLGWAILKFRWEIRWHVFIINQLPLLQSLQVTFEAKVVLSGGVLILIFLILSSPRH